MKKMNMVAKYDAVKAMLNGNTVEGFSLADALTFIDERIVQVEKKNANTANGERKPTKTQLENEGIKSKIADVLSTAETALSIGDIAKANAELADLSNQKLSALVTQMVKAGAVVRTEVKGKAYFALATKE
jgi:hypothetical protein